MGNSVGGYEKSDQHRLASLEKELPFLTVTQNPRKKRNFIFHTGAWKRIVESTRRRGSKMKVNPTCPDEKHSNGDISRRQSRSDKLEDVVVEKPLSCFVINTKEAPPTSFVTTKNNSRMVTHYQQPQTRETTTNRSVVGNSMNGRVTDKHMEAFAAKPAYVRLNNNNVEKIMPAERHSNGKIPSYDEAIKQRVVSVQTHRTNPPPAPKVNPSSGPPKRVIIQASTTELLQCLGKYVSVKCKHVPSLEPNDVIEWMRKVDRSLLCQGWQDISFIMPGSVVFVYMLCRDTLNENVKTAYEVRATILTCLYMSYSYMGNEISYPLRPFLIENDRYVFWERCCQMMNKSSGKMLRINKDSQYFASLFRELMTYSPKIRKEDDPAYTSSSQTRFHPHPPLSVQGSSVFSRNPRHNGRSEYRVAMTAGGC